MTRLIRTKQTVKKHTNNQPHQIYNERTTTPHNPMGWETLTLIGKPKKDPKPPLTQKAKGKQTIRRTQRIKTTTTNNNTKVQMHWLIQSVEDPYLSPEQSLRNETTTNTNKEKQ
jgi:hypothetical protein